MKYIAVFGSSKCPPDDPAYTLARELGRSLAERGFSVVNGGYGGVMEASARGAREAGGKTLGITTREFPSVRNAYVDEEIRVGTWQERLIALMNKADGYVVLEGGSGTLVEFSVAIEMMNKKLIAVKPFVVYGPFWARVKGVLEKNPEIRMDFIKTASSLDEIMNALPLS